MEQNKVRSYFFYALGEIALVMIGILLALQVNNWNESRKESNLRDVLILNYSKDLEGNAAYLLRRRQSIEKALQTINHISERLKVSPLPPDTLKKIALFEFSPIYYAISDIRNDTYMSLISNNQLRLIPDELSTKMVDINFRMDDLVFTQSSVGEFYRANLTEYSFNYPMPEDQSLYSISENEKLWDAMDKEAWKHAFNGVIFTKKAGYTSVLPRIDSLLVHMDAIQLSITTKRSNSN